MTSTKLSRRDAANIAAWRQGIPQTQAGLDGMWGNIVTRLNASLPSKPAIGARISSEPSGGKLTNASVDWAGIVSRMNAEAGHPARSRVR